MRTSRRTIVIVCVAVVLFAAILPAVSGDVSVALVPLWPLLAPVLIVVVVPPREVRRDERLVSLLARLPSRAPPVSAS